MKDILFRSVKIINLEMSANWEHLGAEESIIFVIPYYFMQDIDNILRWAIYLCLWKHDQ